MQNSVSNTSPANLPKSLKVTLFGWHAHVSHENGLNDIISDHIDSSSSPCLKLAHQNLHSLALMRIDAQMQAYLSLADYVWLDGMPLIWMFKALGYPIGREWRITFLDWEHSFWPMANQKQYRVFLLGGKPGVLEKTSAELNALYPDIAFDFHHGYFDFNDSSVLDQINIHKADVLMVGLGMPLQEHWLLHNHEGLNARVLMPLGGYFDYIAGNTYTPPRWSGKLGLEWLFRVLADPKRLWRRYFLEPIPLLFDFIKEFVQRKWRD